MRISDWSSDVCSSNLRSKNHCFNSLDGAQVGDENTRPFPDPKSGEAVAEGYSSGQRGQTVNLLTNVYGGSNPPPSTSIRVGRGARIGTSDMSDARRAWLRTFRFGKPAATGALERSRDSGDGPKGERRTPRMIQKNGRASGRERGGQ